MSIFCFQLQKSNRIYLIFLRHIFVIYKYLKNRHLNRSAIYLFKLIYIVSTCI